MQEFQLFLTHCIFIDHFMQFPSTLSNIALPDLFFFMIFLYFKIITKVKTYRNQFLPELNFSYYLILQKKYVRDGQRWAKCYNVNCLLAHPCPLTNLNFYIANKLFFTQIETVILNAPKHCVIPNNCILYNIPNTFHFYSTFFLYIYEYIYV